MDSNTVIGFVGAFATIAAVVVTHLLSQRLGEKRANQVREEMMTRIETLDARIGDLKGDVLQRVADLRSDLGGQVHVLRDDVSQLRAEFLSWRGELRTEMAEQLAIVRAEFAAVRMEVDRSAERNKHAMILEIRALNAELMSGIARQRAAAARATNNEDRL